MDNRHRDYIIAHSVAEDAINSLRLFQKALKILRKYERGLHGEYDKLDALDGIHPFWESAAEDIKLLGEYVQKAYEPYNEDYGPTHS